MKKYAIVKKKINSGDKIMWDNQELSVEHLKYLHIIEGLWIINEHDRYEVSFN